jgi:DNA polymerase
MNENDSPVTREELLQTLKGYALIFGEKIVLPPDAGLPVAPVAAISSPDAGADADIVPTDAIFSKPSLLYPLPKESAPMNIKIKAEKLLRLEAEADKCRKCPLGNQRKNVVFGCGYPDARLVFCGEAPGEDEDKQGLPFVGRSGQLLTKMIEAMGFKRNETYILNTLRCRPPNNRTPETSEIIACNPFLVAQLNIIKPDVIVALGAPAAQTLLKTDRSIGKLRGRFAEYQGIPLMPTYHPAYLLRSMSLDNRQKVWSDLRAAAVKLGKTPDAPADQPPF